MLILLPSFLKKQISLLCVAVFCAGPVQADFEAALRYGMGVDPARRSAYYLTKATPAELALKNEFANTSFAFISKGFNEGYYTFKGGIMYLGRAGVSDDEMGTSYFIDGFCEVRDSSTESRATLFDQVFPESAIHQTLLMHELAHCQTPKLQLSTRLGHPVLDSLAYIALADPSALFTQSIFENFADVHALLVLRHYNPVQFKKTLAVMLIKRWAEASEFKLLTANSKGNEHFVQHTLTLLTRLDAENALPSRMEAPERMAQFAFATAVKGAALAASKSEWYAQAIDDATETQTLCYRAAITAISNVLAPEKDVSPTYRKSYPMATGGLEGIAYKLAQKRIVALQKVKSNFQELEAQMGILSKDICPTLPVLAPLKFDHFKAEAEELERNYRPDSDLLEKGRKTLQASFASERANTVALKDTPSFEEAATLIAEHRKQFPKKK